MPHANARRRNAPVSSSLLTVCGLLGLFALTAGLLNFAQPSARAAATFNVNSTGDGADANTADNLCDDGSGACTLRAAIQQANAAPGPDTITFQIGGGPQTIKPAQPLPEVTEAVVIDGATQPGYAGAPIIELDGSASFGNGLVLAGGDSTVRALVINRFGGAGVSIRGLRGGNRVEGCYIGVDLTGTLDRGNGRDGIALDNSNNRIGGTTPAARNVISGNRDWGINVARTCCEDWSPIANNVMQGNYVGLSAAGDAAIPNWDGGIRLRLINFGVPISGNLVGGTAPGAGNVISGNAGNGLDVSGGGTTNGNTVQGNFIGTDATGGFAVPNYNGVLLGGVDNLVGGSAPGARNVISGNRGYGVVVEGSGGAAVLGNVIGANAALTAPVPNSSSGVSIGASAYNSVVGGTGAGEANVIAFNAANGLELFRTGWGHRLRGNSIFSNGGAIRPGDASVGLGIDLGPAGVTPNDADDYFGPNRLQNFPVIASVTRGASSFNVKGALESRASAAYDLDFYASGACDSSGFGEGARHVGSAQVTTDSGGNAAFDLTFDVALPANQVLTATATNPEGSTSEFSRCAAAGPATVGVVGFEQTQVSVGEAGGAATFVLTRTGGSAGAVTVNYSVRSGTATAGSDFAATSGALTFADGETSKSFTVAVLEDELDETTSETAVVSLGAAGDLDALGPRNTATLTIADNDPALDLSIGDVSAAEGKSGATVFEFPVTLSAAGGIDGVTLTYTTEFGTAAGGGDDFFSTNTTTLTIPQGQRVGKITVLVRGDAHIEPDETFFVNITSATSATIADGRARGTILNDDVALTFGVNSTGDGADADPADGACRTAAGDCTLRAAIEQAEFTSGTDTINIPVTGVINLTGPLPDIDDNLIINGPGSSLLTVRRDTGGDYRIFHIAGEEYDLDLGLAVSISGLTVANGRTAAGASGDYGQSGGGGGALSNGGALTLTDVTLTGNSTGAGGSGSGSGFGGDGGVGGAVYNFGALTMTNVTLTGNSTGAGGAGSHGGSGGAGGAIYNMGTLTMTGCVVRGNSTGRGGEAKSPSIHGNNDGSGGSGGGGGGIAGSFRPTLTMTDCVVGENTTGAGGDSNVTNGRGGLSGFGAGILGDSGEMTLTRVSVRDNAVGAGGKAPLGVPGGVGGGGGVYFADRYSGGSGRLTDSTVSGNAAGAGAGVLNFGVLRMTNTTVSGNRQSGAGAAVHNGGGPLTLTNCTVAANEGPGLSGGAIVGNTIIAGNGGGAGPDLSGSFNSRGHNLVGNVGGATGFTAAGDQAGTPDAPINPRLGPLADNGGPTLTHAPLAGSPALDAGDDALALGDDSPLAADQRGAGFVRRADAADADTTQTVDIGAFEAHPSVEDVGVRATGPGAPLSFSFNVGDAALGLSSVTAASSDQTLLPDANLSVTGSGSTRTLRLTPAAGASGAATVTLTVTGANGRSMSDAFPLVVNTVNDAPTFVKGADQTVAEDSGPRTINGWATGVTPGPPDESGQSVSFHVTGNTNPGLFSAGPALSPGGALTFTPAPDANGSAVVTVVLRDDGGTAGGGQDATAPQTFNVNVTAVNDRPTNTVPAARTTPRQTPVVFSGAGGFSVADIDAGASPVRLILFADHGTLTLSGTTGLTFVRVGLVFTYVEGDGTDDEAMAFTGTLANVNAALNGLTFKPAQGYTGQGSIRLIADDLGNTGSGGAMSDTDDVAINITDAEGGRLTPVAQPETLESAGTATFKVRRSSGADGATSVNFAATGGAAAGGAACGAGVDYVNTSGTLNWADGDAADKSFTVTLCDDSTPEPDETLGVTLSNATGSATIETPSATTTIMDDDSTGDTVEFGQSVYRANEASGSLTVTVRRAGHTAAAAGVDYATDVTHAAGFVRPCSEAVGVALDRCDFTRAVGRLLFAPGETEKTLRILLSDDSYPEGDEVAFVRLSNPDGGLTLGARATARLEITDNVPELADNPIDAPGVFVRQHYHDFLNREPDADGLRFWANEIESCGFDAQCREVKRINVSAAFFLSIEFQETGYLAYRTYKTAFGDATSPNVPGAVPVVRLDEFLPDTRRIGEGVVVGPGPWQARLDANKNEYLLEFVGRPRFVNAFAPTLAPAQLVDALFSNAGVVPAPAERQAAIDEFGGAPSSSDRSARARALRRVAEHPALVRAELRRAFVLMQYYGYLRRNPDDAPEPGLNFGGWSFWLSKLEEFDGDFVRAEMVRAFLNSDEYRKRFGQ